MALAHKIMGSGANPLLMASLFDVGASLTATGTGASTALALTNAYNEFTSVPSGTGAILYAGTAGDEQEVYNGGTNALLVYPATGRKINSLPTNSAVQIPTNTACKFTILTTARYVGVLSR